MAVRSHYIRHSASPKCVTISSTFLVRRKGQSWTPRVAKILARCYSVLAKYNTRRDVQLWNLTIRFRFIVKFNALGEMNTAGSRTSQRGKGNFGTTETGRLAQLKEQLIMAQLERTYEQLQALHLTDDEIIASLKQVIAQRGPRND